MKKILIASLLLCSSAGLSGCWDRTEINDVAFVIGSCVDKEKNLYRSTLQIALPGNLGGSGSEGGGGGTAGNKSYYLESKTGVTLRNSNMEVQAGNSRKLSFAHRRTLLLGEEFARENVAPMLDQFARIPQNRLSSLVAVTEGPAYKIMDASAPMEQFPSEMIRELMNQFTKRPVNLKLFANDLLSEGIDVSLPYISLQEAVPEGLKDDKKNIQITGLALFKGDRMVGVLKGQEVRMINLAMNQATSPDMLVSGPDGKGYVTIKFTENVAALKPIIRGDQITMRISILAKGAVIENNTDYSLGAKKNMSLLEQNASKEMIKQIHSGLRLLQEKYHSDTLGFGRAIQQKNPRAWERFKGRWDEIYPTVKVVIDTNLHIENIGAVVDKPFGRRDKEIKHD
ncbi:Ger(x)C family spore germination protein [Paenibacillus chibensis]|uniref:Ger(x)C family spore germination protein n=1 Tax=Paenibacillus chibensis TaxID=59846 RepID=UPI000FDA279A|nr:Ger(x)C family spore germination protein [Paenibacillus chibensis]MEC0369542.1 Ger(x)C family spore germination protein [Paenibacillus chibensis]